MGDVVATLLPNCSEMLEVYLAALQAGWYLVPINHHLVAPEVAYILEDSGAKTFIAHERFGDVATAAVGEVGLEGAGLLAVGDVPGFASYADVRDAQPTTLPDDRTVGDVMNYTSGTTGNPKGIYRKLTGVDARAGRSRARRTAVPLRDSTSGRQRPYHRLAALPHRCLAFRECIVASRPHDRADGQVAARGHAPAH